MHFTRTAFLSLLAATTFAMPAPEAHAEAEANELEARGTPYLRFYNKINFKQPLCNYEFNHPTSQDGSCIKTPNCARNTANSVRLKNGVKSCSFFRQSDCEGVSTNLNKDGNLRILLRDHVGSFRCDL